MTDVMKWHREAAREIEIELSPYKGVRTISEVIAAHDPSAELLRECAKAIEPVALWIAPPSPEQWEAMAEWFYRETGVLRPGKDQPASGNGHSDAERELAWSVWCGETKVRIWKELDAALSRLAEAGVRP